MKRNIQTNTTQTNNVRNIGVIAHVDAGKTTVSEKILFFTGKIHKTVEVHEGGATMDSRKSERDHGITISFYYNDPDGNRLEIQAERFATMAEGTEYMKSQAFVENSIGVNFDADEFAARYNAGASAEELFRMPDGPPANIPPEHGIGG